MESIKKKITSKIWKIAINFSFDIPDEAQLDWYAQKRGEGANPTGAFFPDIQILWL